MNSTNDQLSTASAIVGNVLLYAVCFNFLCGGNH